MQSTGNQNKQIGWKESSDPNKGILLIQFQHQKGKKNYKYQGDAGAYNWAIPQQHMNWLV